MCTYNFSFSNPFFRSVYLQLSTSNAELSMKHECGFNACVCLLFNVYLFSFLLSLSLILVILLLHLFWLKFFSLFRGRIHSNLLRTVKNMLFISMTKFHLTCVFSMLRCCRSLFAFQHFETCALCTFK